jgi:flagellin
LLLSALTINASTLEAGTFGSGDQSTVYRLANESIDGTGANSVISLGAVSVGVYKQALQNIATLRAQNGASMSQIEYGYDNLIKQKNNLDTSRGRIMDADIAAESTEFSKNNILVQASTSMLAQANSLTGLALSLIQ